MSISSGFCVSASAVFCVFVLSACSNRESEVPVSLTPGLYEITVAGMIAKEPADSQICFSSRSDNANIRQLVRRQFALYESCVQQAVERDGNSISGAMTCTIDDTSGLRTVYTGELRADALKIEAIMTSYAPAPEASEGVLEEVPVDITLRAKRVGDCS